MDAREVAVLPHVPVPLLANRTLGEITGTLDHHQWMGTRWLGYPGWVSLYGDYFVGSFNTAARISLPGLNLATARLGISTSFTGILRFRPTRALRTLTSKVPNLRNSTANPFATALQM
jgi:hypothetical protein